jgi:hypothetical protein
MARMTTCPDCRAEISARAATCPKCGCPNTPGKPKRRFSLLKLAMVVILLPTFVIFLTRKQGDRPPALPTPAPGPAMVDTAEVEAVTALALPPHRIGTSLKPGINRDQIRAVARAGAPASELQALAVALAESKPTSKALVAFFSDEGPVSGWDGTGPSIDVSAPGYLGSATVDDDGSGRKAGELRPPPAP